MLKRILSALFGPARPPRQPVHDPVFGQMSPSGTGWSARVTCGVESVELTIGGAMVPDPALLSHARDILNDYQSFRSMVRAFVESESKDYPEDAKTELSRLEIDNICLFWPHRPDDGMIFFRGGPDDIGVWRCDYVARRPTNLGCDT